MTQEIPLISEKTSPLFKIVGVHNIDEPERQQFDNNISAFHIGNGYVLSIAHNLRNESGYLRSIDESSFQSDIVSKVDGDHANLLTDYYELDKAKEKRYLIIPDGGDINQIVNCLQQAKFDTRWISLYQRNICKPHLVTQFRESLFYSDVELTEQMKESYVYDETAGKHSFLIKLELIQAFYKEDIAIYKMTGVSEEIIAKIPFIDVDYQLLNSGSQRLYCLQSAPANEAGRLINTAKIEGVLDHCNVFSDVVGGNYVLEGIRYLTKGYFRFGSSGALYVRYNMQKKKFFVNAIQSEASPIQLSIGNNIEGNFQFINAIATPLYQIKKELEQIRA